MIKTQCTVCGKSVLFPETKDEEWNDDRTTKYWFRLKDGSCSPFCDAACALVAHLIRNKKEVPDWLKQCQK